MSAGYCAKAVAKTSIALIAATATNVCAQDVNITGDNYGNACTGHAICIIELPQIALVLDSVTQAKNADSTFTTTAIVHLTTPFEIPSLYLRVDAPDIVSFEAGPNRAGVFMSGPAGDRPGYSFATMESAAGAYSLRIRTKNKTKVQLSYAIN